MKKTVLLNTIILVLLTMRAVQGITPIHVGKLTAPDTTLYETQQRFGYTITPGPLVDGGGALEYHSAIWISAYFKKNSNQYDFFTCGGKIGRAIIPMISENKNIVQLNFSCNMLDEDDGWETIVDYLNEEDIRFFKIYDDDGTELLAGRGRTIYGVDFNNTYVLIQDNSAAFGDINIYRFRNNIATTTPKSLSKTKAAQSPQMQIYTLTNGEYNVTLTPSAGNNVHFQMFDLLGRCVFSKEIGNLTKPVSFTIPEGNVPNSPFIAKVKDGNETLYKKQTPVK